MSDTQENRRISSRRKETRRMCDMLYHGITAEERKLCAMLKYHGYLLNDRRTHKRRSWRDRRLG